MAKRLRWLRWTLAIAALALVAAIAAPFLVPLSAFLPRIAEQASKAVGVPVTIGDLRLRLLPTPRIAAIGIRVGKADEARIEELELVPVLDQSFVHTLEICQELGVLRELPLDLLRRQIMVRRLSESVRVPAPKTRLPRREVWSKTVIQDVDDQLDQLLGVDILC